MVYVITYQIMYCQQLLLVFVHPLVVVCATYQEVSGEMCKVREDFAPDLLPTEGLVG